MADSAAFASKLAGFVAMWTDLRITSAHGLGGQCVDLVEEYISEVFALRPLPGNAIDFWNENLDEWDWTLNNPADLTQIPPPGAVMVWKFYPSIGVGAFGHTDVVISAGAYSFTGFDQNWPVGSNAHQQHHGYSGVMGWGIPHDRLGRSLLGHGDPVVTQPPSHPPPAATGRSGAIDAWDNLRGLFNSQLPTATGQLSALQSDVERLG